MNKHLSLCALVTVASVTGSLTGCSSQNVAESTAAVTLSAASQQQVLNLVNYPATDVNALVGDVGLDRATAQSIVAQRNGADGVTPSSDDFVFETIAQLDAVSGVGASTLSKLAAYAAAHPAPAGETVKGVALTGWQDVAVIWGVNQAETSVLYALLDNRAALSLVQGRPFTTVAAMGTLSYVGAGAVNELRGAATGWWMEKQGAMNDAGRFDGAVFDEAEAETALQIVNQASSAQLTSHKITSSPAKVIIANRPYTSLATVAALSGVGSATMNALLAYAQSGDWSATSGGASCVATFDDAVGPHLGDLLFTSESDRPFNLVAFSGAGTAAPTAAALAALVGAAPNSLLYTRAVADFYSDFEPSSATADPNAAATVEAAFAAQLTDVTYIAIQPQGTTDDSLVDVYLVGRTSCGDLVGIHSVSVET